MLHSLKQLFSSHQNRNAMLRTNILFSALLKAVGIFSSFLLVPVTLGYLDDVAYGVWMVISSVLFWVSASDIGLGNGMRNYMARAIAKEDWDLARSYFSTTLVLLSVIIVFIGAVSISLILKGNLYQFFNTTLIPIHELRTSLLAAMLLTLVFFIVKNLGVIFIAVQKYALSDLLGVSANVISLLLIYLLTHYGDRSLTPVVIAYTATPVALYLLAAIPIFKVYPHLRPHWSDYRRSLAKQLLSKGLGFFFIQVTSCLVLYGCANYFITQYCGPAAVTVFNIPYKYFNLLAMGYLVILSPMWNAYTDAQVKGDYVWIQRNLRRSFYFWLLTVAGGAVLLAGSHLFYGIWIHDKVTVPFSISLCVYAYVCMFSLNNCFCMLINGLNKIRIQIITSIVGTGLYLLFIYWSGNHIQIEGIVYAMAATYGGMALIHAYQCYLLAHRKAKGIWNK